VTTATIHSACECQAGLYARLDEHKQVLSGWAADRRRQKTKNAPAHAIHPGAERFQVGWSCPFCGRNTLRSFDSAGLAYVEEAPPAAENA